LLPPVFALIGLATRDEEEGVKRPESPNTATLARRDGSMLIWLMKEGEKDLRVSIGRKLWPPPKRREEARGGGSRGTRGESRVALGRDEGFMIAWVFSC